MPIDEMNRINEEIAAANQAFADIGAGTFVSIGTPAFLEDSFAFAQSVNMDGVNHRPAAQQWVVCTP